MTSYESDSKNTKFDAIKKAKYIELVSQGTFKTIAAEQVGVTRDTIARHRKKDPEFNEAVSKAEMNLTAQVENALYRNATENDNLGAQVFWLTNRAPDQWADKRNINARLEHSGRVDGKVEVVSPDAAQWAEIAEEIGNIDDED